MEMYIIKFQFNISRISSDDFARKFGSAPSDLSNSIDSGLDTKVSPEAKEEGSLTQTVIELVVKFVPTLINIISGETGPSQTDRIENIDLNVSYIRYL